LPSGVGMGIGARRVRKASSSVRIEFGASLQATEPATLTLPLMHFYSHTPLQTESLCLLTHDVIKQMLCRLFAIACMCAHKHTDSRSLTISLTLLNRAQTAFSVHITCMLYMEYLIHSIQVTMYTSARVLCSCVTRFLSLPLHIRSLFFLRRLGYLCTSVPLDTPLILLQYLSR